MSARGRELSWLPGATLLLLLSFHILCLLFLNRGSFTYGIDDIYTSMRMAEQMLHGTYGINAGEAASACSSILWPFLLLPFAAIGFLDQAPLMLGFVFGLMAAQLMGKCILLAYGREAEKFPIHMAVMAALMVPAMNLPALVLMGMEHVLQIWLTLMAAHGMLKMHLKKERPGLPFLAALVLGPLVRYENLAVSGAVLMYLLLRGEWKRAVPAGAAIAAGMGGFAAFLGSMGLLPLPNSALTKLVMGGPFWLEWLKRLLDIQPWVMLFGLIAFGMKAAKGKKEERGFALIAALPLLAHFLVGRIDRTNRFELYAYAFSVPMLLFLYRGEIASLLKAKSPREGMVRVVVGTLCIFFTYAVHSLWQAPAASHAIYLQQGQMARFAQEFYKAPVGVNDIGRVSYGARAYVLDFAGISSEDARKAVWGLKKGKDPLWMDTLAEAHGVRLAMVYDAWYRRFIPAHWQKVAVLRMEGAPITADSGEVSFYATSRTEAARVKPLLAAFAKTLPKGAHLTTD